MQARKAPWEMTLDEFVGPHMISEVFGIDGDEEAWEPVWGTTPEDTGAVLWTSEDGEFSIRDLEWDRNPSIVLFRHGPDGGEPVGFYLVGQSFVEAEYRGRGLGVALVLAAAEICGGSPTVNGCGMGFSAAGYGVHAAAHRIAVERAVERGLPVPPEVLEEYGLPVPGGPKP